MTDRQSQLRQAGERQLRLVRSTLNGLSPRTEQDAARDPSDWWDAPEPRHQSSAADKAFAVALGILGAILLFYFLSK